MPDLAMHYYFGQMVRKELPEDIRIEPDVFEFALSGPDDWFYCFTNVNKCARGSFMHRQRTGAFLKNLAAEPILFSYFAGFYCHYILDATCHPYIIACTGYYDKTIETRQYQGNHTALERALDRWILKENHNDSKHPMTDGMLGKPLPADLEQSLDQVYRDVYGWDPIFPDLLDAKRKMYRYLRIMEDPHGFAKLASDIVRHPLLRPLPYSRHYYESKDILNLEHRTWHHPKDYSLTSTSSVPELVEQARQEALQAIPAAYHGDFSLIGNRHYLTGFDLDDIRNKAKETYPSLL